MRIDRERLAHLPTLLLLGLALSACSSIPEVQFATGSRVEVRLYDAHSGFELWLANTSHPGLQNVYSKRRSSGALKLAPDELMGQLLASLQRAELNKFATQHPDKHLEGTQLANASTAFTVIRNASWLSWNEPASGASREERAAFVRCKLIMNEYYSHVGGMQFIANPEGGGRLRNQEVEINP